jgi:hypothetical protein
MARSEATGKGVRELTSRGRETFRFRRLHRNGRASRLLLLFVRFPIPSRIGISVGLASDHLQVGDIRRVAHHLFPVRSPPAYRQRKLAVW